MGGLIDRLKDWQIGIILDVNWKHGQIKRRKDCKTAKRMGLPLDTAKKSVFRFDHVDYRTLKTYLKMDGSMDFKVPKEMPCKLYPGTIYPGLGAVPVPLQTDLRIIYNEAILIFAILV